MSQTTTPINPDYGTLDDFKRLVAEAKQRDIRIIIDFVLNHTSSEHPWFVASQDPQSPYRDWYVWSETDPGQANWHRAANGDYYYGYFGEAHARSELHQPRSHREDGTTWRASGCKTSASMDCASMRPSTSSKKARSFRIPIRRMSGIRTSGLNTKQYKPDAMTIGEVWDLAPVSAEYAQGDELDLTFDFDLAQAIITGVRARRAEGIAKAYRVNQNVFKPLQFGSFLTNHDQNRVVSQLAGDLDRAKLAAVIYLTGPGVPFVYYGEEIGMLGKKPDEDIRTPMQWDAERNGGFTDNIPWRMPYTDYPKKNVDAQSADPDSIWSLYRQLIHLRNRARRLARGRLRGSADEQLGSLRGAAREQRRSSADRRQFRQRRGE